MVDTQFYHVTGLLEHIQYWIKCIDDTLQEHICTSRSYEPCIKRHFHDITRRFCNRLTDSDFFEVTHYCRQPVFEATHTLFIIIGCQHDEKSIVAGFCRQLHVINSHFRLLLFVVQEVFVYPHTVFISFLSIVLSHVFV